MWLDMGNNGVIVHKGRYRSDSDNMGCICVCLSIYVSIYLSMYLSIYPSIYLSIYPSIYLTIAGCDENPSSLQVGPAQEVCRDPAVLQLGDECCGWRPSADVESPKWFDKKMWFSHGKWEGNNKTDVSRTRSRLNKTNNWGFWFN